MTLFGKIVSMDDVLSRVPQLENQLERLEQENSISRRNSHLRNSFVRRCHEFSKQVEEQKSRVNSMKNREGSQEQKLAALLKLNDFQMRASIMAPERDRTSGENSSTAQTRDTPSSPEIEEERPSQKSLSARRPSMYDGDTSSEEEDNSDREKEKEKKEAPEPLHVIGKQESNAIRVTHPSSSTKMQKTRPGSNNTVISVDETVKEKEEETDKNSLVDGNKFEVLADFSGEESSDLPLEKGEILTILQTRADGWWTARNKDGRQGLVPKTFLRHVQSEEQSAPAPKPRTNAPEISAHAPRVGTAVPEERDTETRINIEKVANPPTTPIRCLGDAASKDLHLSYACHLTPRLSHSNLGFHDLYWNFQDDKLRKRRVRVSRLIRLVRFEGMPKVDVECGLIRVVLYDQSRKTGRQLVSNVHTLRAQVKNGTWNFITRTDTANSGVELGDFILRSNYKMTDVVLLLEASIVQRTESGFAEKSLGTMKLPIIGANGTCCLLNKTYTDFLTNDNIFDHSQQNSEKTSHRIVMKVLEVPSEIVSFVDSMPDVLLFNPMHVRTIFFYRRRAGTVLIRDRENPLSAEMVSDPLLAVFPFIADQPDLMDLLRSLWNSRLKSVKNLSESSQAQSFFQIFMNTAYCIHRTAFIPDYCIYNRNVLAQRQEVFTKCVEMFREYKTAARFLLTTPSKPINIYDYSLDLMGAHALD